MLIAQISDLHVTTPDAPRRLVDTTASLQRAVEVLNTMQPRPDCVIATGDLVDYGTDVEYRILFDVLRALELPLYLLPGNHDDAPLLRMHLQMQGFLRADEPGHLGTVIDSHDVRLVLVDTTDPKRHDGVFPEVRAAWLDRVLSAAPDRPTLVAMHHPPFATGIWWMDVLGIEATDRARFETVVRRHPQVHQVISGHIHRAISRSWDSTVLTVCPSTAHQVALSLGRGAPALMSLEPPSFQLHQWTGDGFVTNTRPLDVPGVYDISARLPDWEATKERFAHGGPFPKDEPLF
jgi:3',5'-cyclic-AMP phosphodiesterase